MTYRSPWLPCAQNISAPFQKHPHILSSVINTSNNMWLQYYVSYISICRKKTVANSKQEVSGAKKNKIKSGVYTHIHCTKYINTLLRRWVLIRIKTNMANNDMKGHETLTVLVIAALKVKGVFFPWKTKNNFSATALSGAVFGEHFGSVCHSSRGKVWGMNLWCTLETAQTACICQICVFKTQALTWAICPSKYSTQHVHLVHFEVLLYSTGPLFFFCFNSSSASFHLDRPPLLVFNI